MGRANASSGIILVNVNNQFEMIWKDDGHFAVVILKYE